MHLSQKALNFQPRVYPTARKQNAGRKIVRENSPVGRAAPHRLRPAGEKPSRAGRA